MKQMKLRNSLHDTVQISAMAADLIRLDATGNESDAIRALFGRYGYADVALFAEHARRLALLSMSMQRKIAA